MAQPTFLLARHGEKESESGPLNWALKLTPDGVADVASTAAFCASRALSPTRIIASPFHRCVETAAIYAAAFRLPSICIEPGLCEVLSPSLGAKGLAAPPAWAAEELAAIARRHAPAIALDASYIPIVPAAALRFELSDTHRDEAQGRAERVAAAITGAKPQPQPQLLMLVSHGSLTRRMVDCLAPPTPGGSRCSEPAMGSVLHVEEGRVAGYVVPLRGAEPWACAACKQENGAGSADCAGCSTLRPAAIAAPPPRISMEE